MSKQTEVTVSGQIENKDLILKTGKLAKQANGSVLIQNGDMVLLATAVMSKQPKEGIDFLPLTIEFAEKMYASGKIPGGFFKREARPSTNATLTARLIDRPLRPSFPKYFHNDVQIIISVLSYDPNVSIEPYSIIAASAALSVSDIPFNGPIGAALVGRMNGEYIINPSPEELTKSDLNLIVAGTSEAVLMVEAGANEVSEEIIIDGIMKGHEAIKQSISIQKDLVEQAGKQKADSPTEPEAFATYRNKINDFIGDKIDSLLDNGHSKQEVDSFLTTLESNVKETFVTEDADNESDVLAVFNAVKKKKIRSAIIQKKVRVDGRKTNEIRSLDIDTSILPSTHGSSLFTRGETQSLGVVTLGTIEDSQIVDSFEEAENSKYFFHYNFPPYSVGECGRMATSRRELGHGALAERSLLPILPDMEAFPYTIRIVSEILESNGSSSMASVCSGSLALMDAGVPIKSGVSGIAMGLLLDENGYIILSDIQGLEDHYGDMDFKVAGTKTGITSLQLDIKVAGLSKDILKEALAQAKEGRLYILDEMNNVIRESKSEVSDLAPKIKSIFIDPDKVGMVIGSGGKMIRKLEEDSGASIVVSDGNSGEVVISSKRGEYLNKAIYLIETLLKEPEVGEEYNGKVVKTVTFGAFIELVPGKEGLLHISKIAKERVNNVEDYLNVGDAVKVKIEKIDNQNRINLERIF